MSAEIGDAVCVELDAAAWSVVELWGCFGRIWELWQVFDFEISWQPVSSELAQN